MTASTLSEILSRGKRFSQISKEALYILIGQIATILGSLTLVRILTEFLEPTEYGKFALAITGIALMNQLIMGPVSNAIGRFYSVANEAGDVTGYHKGSMRLFGWAALFVCAAGLIATAWLILRRQLELITLIAPLVAFSILSGCSAIFNNVQNVARRRALVAIHTAAESWLRVALAYVTVSFMHGSSSAVLGAYAFAALVVSASQGTFLYRSTLKASVQQRTATSRRWTTELWGYSWPFSAWGIFTWAQQASDRWALQAYATTSEVGKYAAAFQLSFAPIGMATGLFISLVSPIFFEHAGDASDPRRNARNHAAVLRLASLGLFVTACAFAAALVFHETVFRLFVAESFRPASRFFPWLVLAGGLFAAGQTLSLKFLSEIRPQALLRVKITTALLGAIANVLGARALGMAGVVAAVVLFSTAYFSWMLRLALADTHGK